MYSWYLSMKLEDYGTRQLVGFVENTEGGQVSNCFCISGPHGVEKAGLGHDGSTIGAALRYLRNREVP